MKNKSNKENMNLKSEKLELIELEQILNQSFSDYSIGSYALDSNIDPADILKNGIKISKKENDIFKSKIKHMGVVKNASFKDVVKCPSEIHSVKNLKSISINVILLMPQIFTFDKETYFLGHYPYEGEYPKFNNNGAIIVDDVSIVSILNNNVDSIPPAFIFGYIVNEKSLIDENDINSVFISNPRYYALLNDKEKAQADNTILRWANLSKLIRVGAVSEDSSVSMYQKQYFEYMHPEFNRDDDDKLKARFSQIVDMGISNLKR